MNRRTFVLGSLAPACCALAGCNLGPDYKRPALDIPDAFRATPGSAQAAWPAPDWWRGFRSDELTALIERARGYNNDLIAAAARVVQADAQARISGAPLLPTINGTGDFNYQRTGLSGSRSRGGTTTVAIPNAGGIGGTTAGLATTSGGSRYFDSRTYSLGLSASYDVDFWGRNRATYEAAQATALATAFDQETVALTVVTSVATTYFQMLSGQDRLGIARRNLADAERILAAYKARLAAGTANALDVSQQEALVAAIRASIPALQNTVEQQRIALGLLVGTPPERVNPVGGSLETLALPEVAPGLPSELLLRRPDVAFAEANLVSANASIRAARAAFFPQISLTASGGLTSTALSTLTGPGTLVASLAAALTQPIFDNGLRRGQLEQAKGRYYELAANYGRAILQSFNDTEQALAAFQFYTEQERLEREAVRIAQRSADIARAQLEAGTIDIITSLNTQTTLYNDLDQLAQIRLLRFEALVNLYKALGGGFQTGPVA